MELDRGGGINSKRWTDVTDCDLNHYAPRTVVGLTAPWYQATEHWQGDQADK
jgi:hypothetical protein